MKIKITFIVTILAALICFGGSQLGAAHHSSSGHVVKQSKKARAMAKCRLKATPEEKKECKDKVKAKYAHSGGHS